MFSAQCHGILPGFPAFPANAPPEPVTSPLIRLSLPYLPDLGHRLRLASRPEDHSVWLRTGSEGEIFAACPKDRLVSHTNLEESWSQARQLLEILPPLSASTLPGLPFRGGLIGFVAYDNRPLANHHFPAAYFGLYPSFIHINHDRQKAEAIQLAGFPAEAWERWLEHCHAAGVFLPVMPTPPSANFRLTRAFSSLTPREQYEAHFRRIQEYLRAGDCYQVNYAQAFRAHCQGSSAVAMQRLLALSNPAHAAWLSLPEGDVLSLSPELFLQVKGGEILASPIKGTAPRLPDPEADAEQAAALRQSPKNRAENLMIVDLLRNDISRHAETGSVTAERLFMIESLPQVHHLVSHITGNIKKDSHPIELIRDCFPGGSITGAPKKRAMEIIEELEPTPRSLYCGSIGFINGNGDASFNIAIRTLLRLEDELYAWAGGGIVMDSDCDTEYQECFDKMGALMRALEEM